MAWDEEEGEVADEFFEQCENMGELSGNNNMVKNNGMLL